MKIGVIQASSQADKNGLLFHAARAYAAGSETVDFGCDGTEKERYGYIEISLMAGLLLASGAVGFIVTGCSSGQGMMLACNSFPGVLCGYAPTPKDAYLFAQINCGNAVSLPLGEGYTWAGRDNLEKTLQSLFSEPFGQGWPKSEAERKLRDTALLKRVRACSQTDVLTFLNRLDGQLVEKALSKRDVTDYILAEGTVRAVTDWVRERREGRGTP